MAVKFPGQVEDGWQCPSMKAATRFSDRVPESEALRESLRVHRRAIDGDEIDGESMNNILVFYGVGGVGKSTLSEHMEAWITGKLPADFHWGEPPTDLNVATVRWDLRSEQQLTSPVPFYLNLRRAMAQAGFSTPIFDVGVAVLGARFKISVAHEGDHYAELADDLAAEVLRDALPGVPAMSIEQQAAGLMPGRYLLSQVSDPAVLESLADIHGDLPAALKTVLRGEASVDRLKAAAPMVGWMLSEDIQQLSTTERPLPVVFLDTFEKLRNRTLTRDEEVVNSVVGALPYCLFVVTGRLLVGWADPKRTDLQHAGSATWPSLARTRALEPEPRQHLVGTLDEDDARDVLEYCMAGVDAPFEDDLVASLARTTQLPEHIDATVILARRFALSNPGGTLTLAALGGSFKDVVERLMEHLSPQQAQLLQAAATTPQFDIPLVAAMAQVPYAVAEQAMDNPLVQRLVGQDFFPYHLHDEIRRLVNEAGPEVRHAWAPLDRREAAQRGLDHLEARLKEAIKEDVFEPRFAIHALGYRVAADHGIDSEWVATEFANGPSPTQTARLISHVDGDPPQMLFQARLNAIRVTFGVERESLIKELMGAESGQPLFYESIQPYLPFSYVNLDLAHGGAALVKLIRMERKSHVRSKLLRLLLFKRLHRAALQASLALGDEGLWVGRQVLFSEGFLEESLRVAESTRSGSSVGRRSRRAMQVRGFSISRRRWLGGLGNEELARDLTDAVILGDRFATAEAWCSVALYSIFDHGVVAEAWERISCIPLDGLSRLVPLQSMLHIAGFRLLACGDRGYLDRLGEERSRWSLRDIPLEFLWEHIHDLGLVDHRVPAILSDWVGDREEIKQRWIAIFHRLIDEARARNEGVIDE